MPSLHLFANTFLRSLQSMILHFNSLYQLLPNRPFVFPTATAGAVEPLSVSYDILRRTACPLPAALICSKPMSELRRLNDVLRARARALPSEVQYYSIVSHSNPTTVACRRAPNGELNAIQPRCGDGTVPAISAALLPSPTVRNRFLETMLMHSDLLRERRVLDVVLNVARGQGALPVAGVAEISPACAANDITAAA
jgi:hypothetical protein